MMVKKEIIPHLKSCYLALGLTEVDDSQPYAIVGSGFSPESFEKLVPVIMLQAENNYSGS